MSKVNNEGIISCNGKFYIKTKNKINNGNINDFDYYIYNNNCISHPNLSNNKKKQAFVYRPYTENKKFYKIVYDLWHSYDTDLRFIMNNSIINHVVCYVITYSFKTKIFRLLYKYNHSGKSTSFGGTKNPSNIVNKFNKLQLELLDESSLVLTNTNCLYISPPFMKRVGKQNNVLCSFVILNDYYCTNLFIPEHINSSYTKNNFNWKTKQWKKKPGGKFNISKVLWDNWDKLPYNRYWRSMDKSTLQSLVWYINKVIIQIKNNGLAYHNNYNIVILNSVSSETVNLVNCLNKKKFENLRKSMTVPNQPIFVWDDLCEKSTWNYNALKKMKDCYL